MGNILTAVTAMVVSVHVLMLVTVSPAAAISAELAKKCRELAIKAHPPQPAGTKAYAQAEREYFRECIERNGEMPNDSPRNGPAADPK